MRRLAGSRTGSTLIWTLVIMLILMIIMAAVLSISSRSLSRASNSHVDEQSYYTAFSLSRRIAEWMVTPAEVDTSGLNIVSEPYTIIRALDSYGSQTFSFPTNQLGNGMGRAEMKIQYAPGSESTKIDITTTATYRNRTTTVTATINKPKEALYGTLVYGDASNAADRSVAFTVPVTGTYKIEAWGAQGGYGRAHAESNSPVQIGGLGGYASGEILLQEGTVLWLTAGGQGNPTANNGKADGGSNGGGGTSGVKNYTSNTDNLTTAADITASAGSGGGASDVRVAMPDGSMSDLSHRILVAGGGGGASGQRLSSYGPGGAGGGLSGLPNGRGGAMTSAMTLGGGAFGQGADGSSAAVAAGGGGWYGGGAWTPNSKQSVAGAGGSGFVLENTDVCRSYLPPDYFSDYSDYYFKNALNLNGSNAIPSHNGTGKMTGNSGAGLVKISQVDTSAFVMPPTNIVPNIGPTSGFLPKDHAYVTDNLILYLDGYNRDGQGDAENSGTAEWKDLSGKGNDFKLTDITQNERSLSFEKATSAITLKAATVPDSLNFTKYSALTVELCMKKATDSALETVVRTPLPNMFTLTGTGQNGLYALIKEELGLGGELASVRIYGAALTQDQRTQNDETDKFRFISPTVVTLGNSLCKDVVVVDDKTIKCKTPLAVEGGLVQNTVTTLGAKKPQFVSNNAYYYRTTDSGTDRFEVTKIIGNKTGSIAGDTEGKQLVTIKGKGFLYPPEGANLPLYAGYEYNSAGVMVAAANAPYLHWDAINNVGAGYGKAAHSLTAEIWKDISGHSNDGTILGAGSNIENHWNNNSFYQGPDGSKDNSRWVISKVFAKNLSRAAIELVYEPPNTDESQNSFIAVGSDGRTALTKDNFASTDAWNQGPWSRFGSKWWTNNGGSKDTESTPSVAGEVHPGIQSRTYLYNADTAIGSLGQYAVYMLQDGETYTGVYPGVKYTWNQNPQISIRPIVQLRLQSLLSSNGIQKHRYYSVRVYDRILSADEVNQNRIADEARVLGLVPISVRFDNLDATDITIVDDETITCFTPEHAKGTVSVTVALYGEEETIENGFAYTYNPKKLIQYRMGE